MARKPVKLVRLKAPAGDDHMADTLLFLLRYVREGKIKAFSICLIGERPDGSEFTIESATATAGDEDQDRRELQLLGVMRGAENGLFRRREERHGL